METFELPPFLPIGIDEALTEERIEDRLRDVSNKSFKAYLSTRKIGSYHAETYEESIDVIIDKVRSLELPLDSEGKLKITFTDIRLEKPTVTPIECRKRSLHYTGKLKARSVLTIEDGNKRFESREMVTLCELPIMVRSKYCILYDIYSEYDQANDELMALNQVRIAGQTVAEQMFPGAEERFRKAANALQEAGADPADPGKYFIMDGVPRVILLTEKLRLNIPYVYMESGKTVLSLSMWSPRPITSILRIVGENVTNKNDAENLYMNIFFQNSIFKPVHGTTGQMNIFYLFRILGVTTQEDMVTIIKRIFPTYDDPKRASVLETIITVCTKSMTDCFAGVPDEDKFFRLVYANNFKQHIIGMYPMKQVIDSMTNQQYLEATAVDLEGIPEDEAESEETQSAQTEIAIEYVKAWCQQVICLNTMSHLQLAGEKFGTNYNWFDEQDDGSVIHVYNPKFKRDVHARVYNFATLLIKYCLTRIGELKPANRDSWENKRLLTTGERFATQFHHSFFRAVKSDKTANKISNTVFERAQSYWNNLPDEDKYKIITGEISVDQILNQIKIKTSFTWSNAQIREGMTEEERREAERQILEKADKKNQVCDLACKHDADVIVPLVLEDFWNAFKKRGWGIKGMESYWEKDVTDTLNVNQSDLHTYNQLCQVVVRTNEQSKNIQPRLVQESQFYFVCPVVTPEGPNVGKTKQLAVGTVVSGSHLRQPDLEQFMRVISSSPNVRLYRSWVDSNGNSLTGLCRLFYNGCFIGLCEGKEMRDYLMDLRRQQILFKDCCIAFDEMFQLHVTTEGSRLMRPVFRLSENGNPLFLEDSVRKYISKPYLMSKDWKEMEERGYIEYIDAWEQMSGFYMTQGNKPFFIKSVDDIPVADRDIKQVFKPFPSGLLIANSIWDIYELRDKTKYTLNKERALTKIVNYLLSNPEDLIPKVVKPTKQAMLTIAFGVTVSQEEIQQANDILTAVGKIILDKVSLNPDESIGQGKRFSSVYPDTIKAITLSKKNFERTTPDMEIKDKIIEYLNVEISGLKKMILDLSIRNRFTHATISPAMLYSAVALDIPYLSHIHGPRANLASKFNQQSIRGRHMNHDVLMPGEVKVLENPEIPLVVTSTSGFTGLAHHPAGQNVIVAVACFEGENQEDSLIFNRKSIEQGMFSYTRYYTETLSKDSDEIGIFGSEMYHRSSSKKGELVFGKHEVIHRNDSRYRHISRKGGLPKPGIFLNPRDCIIAAYEGDIDRSIYVKEDGAGYVDRVTVTKNFAGNPVVKVRVKQVLQPIVGDKFASRHAQKCTIGRIADPEDMPFVAGTGLRPDIIMNPHALPSRQTVGQVLEMVAAKAALLKGERVVADVFEKPNIQNMVETLKAYGYDQSGQEVLIDPKTGEKFSSKVLIGPCYYQALKHQVKYKIQSREGFGAIDTVTGQPIGGRQVKGGTREGTMETAILNMSDSMALHQCMVSDPYPVRVCKACGSYVTPSSISTTQGVCEAVSCTYCKNVSNTRFASLRSKLELTPRPVQEEFVDLLLANFTDLSKVGSIPEVLNMIENIKTSTEGFSASVAPFIFFEAIRQALFPNALTELVEGALDDETKASIDKFSTELRTFWENLLDKVMTVNRKLYRETVKIDSIRPILKIDWQTTIIPQSSMVFFRYINQMGYRTKFRFSPANQSLLKVIPNETEQQILQMTQEFIVNNGPINQIRTTDLISHIQSSFPEINISRGTPVWNLISGYVQQQKAI